MTLRKIPEDEPKIRKQILKEKLQKYWKGRWKVKKNLKKLYTLNKTGSGLGIYFLHIHSHELQAGLHAGVSSTDSAK